ncbi:MAG: helix-turn-helix domain-containing protein [Limisphaerales bacterium]
MNALLNAAWDAVCDEPSDKLVLVYLADRANTKSKAWPHLPTIARHTGLGRSTIIEAVKRLEARGHLTVTRQQGCRNYYL